ncbi:MAG: hypothetical protein HWE07_15840 [Cytophagia bacterium]|nr:hypothetical protein [Cytophagia bacterium]
MKIKFFHNLIIIFTIIFISGASILSQDDIYQIIFFVVLLGVAILKKIQLNKFFLLILIFWFLINLVAIIFISTPFYIYGFLGVIIRFSIAYLSLKIIGSELFWMKLENIIFKLTFISLPIFLLNILFPQEFSSFVTLFKPITNEIFYAKEIQSNYWYSFFYTHTGRPEFRNAGFMWEPGAFGMMIVIFVGFNWVKFGFSFDKRIIVYFLALITTFSTAGYLAFSLLFMAFTIYTKKFYLAIFAIGIFIIFSGLILNLEFLLPKINLYLENVANQEVYFQSHTDRIEANRVLYFYFNFLKIIEYPIGYGVLEDKNSFLNPIKTVGVNGLGEILYTWGWLGLFYVVKNIIVFFKIDNKICLTSLLIAVACLVTFFSNPIENNIILPLLIFTPLIKGRS